MSRKCSLALDEEVFGLRRLENREWRSTRETRINLGDPRANSARMSVLRHDDSHAQNTFDEPNTLRPVEMFTLAANAIISHLDHPSLGNFGSVSLSDIAVDGITSIYKLPKDAAPCNASRGLS